MIKKGSILIIVFSLFFIQEAISQSNKRKLFSKNKKEQKISYQKNNESKDDYRYKSYFYSALKYKALSDLQKAIIDFEECIKINSLESAPYYEIAKIHFSNDNYSQTIEFIKKAVELDKENKWYLEFYGETLFNLFRFNEAIIVCKDLIKRDKTNEDYYINLAKAYIWNNNFNGAIRTYNDLEKVKGVNYYTSIQKYQLYIDQKKINEAAKELEILLKHTPNDLEVCELLSDCYILNNDFDKAFDLLKKISELNPEDGSIHLRLSDFYLKKSNKEKYLEELFLAFSSENLDSELKLKKLLMMIQDHTENGIHELEYLIHISKTIIDLHPKNDKGHYIYADLLNTNKDFSKAIIHYKKSVQINPNQQYAWIELLLLYLHKNNYNSLVIESKEALEFFPTNATIYYLNSLGNYNLKNYLKAIESIETGVNFVGNNNSLASEMYGLLGSLYNTMKNYKYSDEAYELSLDLSPRNAITLNNYAYYLALRGEKLEKAEKMSKKSIELFPEEGNYYDTYAWILYKMKKYSEAKKYIEIAIQKGQHSSVVVMEHMRDILFELGEIEESERFKKKAIELNNLQKKKND